MIQFKATKSNKINEVDYFPDDFEDVEGGLIGFGYEISTPLLLEAYSKGIFPWPQNNTEILWFSPDERGILYFKNLHISQSLKKIIRQKVDKGVWTFKVNSDFAQVIQACAKQKRVHEESTWITSKIIQAYKQLHQEGYAHSFEIWENEILIGGLYCVFINGVWSGESMFFKQDNASKVAFAMMCLLLKEQGFDFLDTQMVTPITESFGAQLIARESYLQELHKVHLKLK